MAKVMTPEQFRQCPEGTVFAYGSRWAFGSLLVLDCFMGPYEGGGWGFYATNPMWVDGKDMNETFDRLQAMDVDDASFPAETAGRKHMVYDGNPMDVFFVFEESDWLALRAMVEPSFKAKEPSDRSAK